MFLRSNHRCYRNCVIVLLLLTILTTTTTTTTTTNAAFVHRSSLGSSTLKSTMSLSLQSLRHQFVSSFVPSTKSISIPIISPKDSPLFWKQQQQRHVAVSSSSSSFSLFAASPQQDDGDDDKEEEKEEWHPHDPAYTTPQLLAGIWFQIAQAKSMVKGVRWRFE